MPKMAPDAPLRQLSDEVRGMFKRETYTDGEPLGA